MAAFPDEVNILNSLPQDAGTIAPKNVSFGYSSVFLLDTDFPRD